MYARRVDTHPEPLNLGVSGKLWNRSLVMYDKETESLWSHILGKAMDGPLEGTVLTSIPSVITDWQTWSKNHPEGSVLWMNRTAHEFGTEFFRRPDQFVLGIAEGDDTHAWRFDQLIEHPVLNDTWRETPVVAVFEPDSFTARLYARTIDDQSLSFQVGEQESTFVDRETESTWVRSTGLAVDGPLKGKSLTALPAFISYRRAWQAFHGN